MAIILSFTFIFPYLTFETEKNTYSKKMKVHTQNFLQHKRMVIIKVGFDERGWASEISILQWKK